MVDKRLEKMNASGEGKKLYIHLKQKHLYHLYFMHTLILIFFFPFYEIVLYLIICIEHHPILFFVILFFSLFVHDKEMLKLTSPLQTKKIHKKSLHR